MFSKHSKLVKELHAVLPDISFASGEAEYDSLSSPWNTRCNPKPFAVVKARNAQDVSNAVSFAAKHKIFVQAKCGGHSFGSHSLGGADGALVVDMSAINDVKVHQEKDPKALWKAEIGGGTLLGKVTDELFKQGERAIAHGTCPSVGIGGHATIGGQGPTSRLWGLTLDHVVGAEIVLADGSIKTINADNEPDLFWAIRGAGASFGIITKFIFITHPAHNDIEYYTLQYNVGDPQQLSDAFQDWQTYLLDPTTLEDRYFNSVCSIGPQSFVVRGSRLQGGKDKKHAQRLESKIDFHIGDKIEVKKSWTLDWLAHADKWAQDEVFNFFGGKQASSYIKGMMVPRETPLTKAATKALFQHFNDHPPGHGLIWFLLADYELGKIADHSNSETPYVHRNALYTLCAYVIDPIPGREFPQEGLDFLQGAWKAIADAMPDLKYGTYPGYIDPELPAAEAARQYWGDNYARLQQVKLQYDPNDVFRNPQSVAVQGAKEDPLVPSTHGRSCPACIIM